MTRVHVYLPDELIEQARQARVNISEVTQVALRVALSETNTDRWLDDLEALPHAEVSHASVISAIDAARGESG